MARWVQEKSSDSAEVRTGSPCPVELRLGALIASTPHQATCAAAGIRRTDHDHDSIDVFIGLTSVRASMLRAKLSDAERPRILGRPWQHPVGRSVCRAVAFLSWPTRRRVSGWGIALTLRRAQSRTHLHPGEVKTSAIDPFRIVAVHRNDWNTSIRRVGRWTTGRTATSASPEDYSGPVC